MAALGQRRLQRHSRDLRHQVQYNGHLGPRRGRRPGEGKDRGAADAIFCELNLPLLPGQALFAVVKGDDAFDSNPFEGAGIGRGRPQLGQAGVELGAAVAQGL